ncbi:MAG: bifunctional shikimate kinase/3-dehydroquinate synthase [Sandaracinaceae bacterium]|nr:bifunctional shikimate kinase/3-dehydroquinate synthase [Sandaracinaceae bacterium]
MAKSMIALSGPMGVGKSTVAPLLAQRLGWPWVDIDREIERRVGERLPHLIRKKGEAFFRRLEADCVREQLGKGPPMVLALGGGAVEDRALRHELLEHTVLVTLKARPETLLSRLSDRPSERPLLDSENLLASIVRIVDRRKEAYAEAHRVLWTDAKSPEEVVEEVLKGFARDRFSIVVPLGHRSHQVTVGRGVWAWLKEALAELAPSMLLVVIDSGAAPLVRPWIEALPWPRRKFFVSGGEASKSLSVLERIWDWALSEPIDREAVMLAIGGGAVGDLSAFAAGTLLRGLRLIHLPTTLLAMVDSAIGGKAALDRPQGKNLVGLFHWPSLVLCDLNALPSLPLPERRSALAELIKVAWISGEKDLRWLEERLELLLKPEPAWEVLEEAVNMAIRVKVRLVARDPEDRDVRRWLNFGHTYGHALEASSGYTLRHGEAVAMGMRVEMAMALALGFASEQDQERLRAILERAGFRASKVGPDLSSIAEFLQVDKKAHARCLEWVLPSKPGTMVRCRLSREESIELVKRCAPSC